MPQFYRVLKADPLGDPWTPDKPNAKPIQRFWCQVEGVNDPVMINKQVPNTPSLTEGHYGVLEQTTSSKGNPYWKFTSMQIPQGTSKPRYAGDAAPVPTAPAQPEPSGVSAKMFHDLEQRVDNLEKLLATPVDKLPQTATEVEDKPTGDVDEDKLKEIFGEDIDIVDVTPKEGTDGTDESDKAAPQG